MKQVEAINLGNFEVVGEREEEAAAALEERYLELCRNAGDGDSMLWQLAALRREVAEEFGVQIKLV